MVVRFGVRMVVRMGLWMVVRMGMIMVVRMEPIPAHREKRKTRIMVEDEPK